MVSLAANGYRLSYGSIRYKILSEIELSTLKRFMEFTLPVAKIGVRQQMTVGEKD